MDIETQQMKHLYFCRHGQSVLNLEATYAGQLDTPLTNYGREQAKLAGMEAKLLGIDLVVSSPLVRALESAQIIASEIGYPEDKIKINDLLQERSLGSLEGKPWKDYAEDDSVFHDIESLESLGARAQQALNYLQRLDASNVLVVGHGSFALALCDLVGYDTRGEELPNAHIVHLA
jgi:broad specificity phosphatase PhoE